MGPIGKLSADYLRHTASTPAVIAIRSRGWAFLGLRPGGRVLDIGCGPGTATYGLAALVGPFGRVTGIDNNPEMVREANSASYAAGVTGWTVNQVADAAALPFVPASFDACYCERLLQHLEPEQSERVIDEAKRVVVPGGAVVFVDSDWGSFSMDAVDPAIERTLQAINCTRFRNPYSGRTLGRLLRRHGFGYVVTEPVAVPLSAHSVALLSAAAEEEAARAGSLDEAALARWRAHLGAMQAYGGIAGHLTMVIAAGRRV